MYMKRLLNDDIIEVVPQLTELLIKIIIMT